MLPQLKCSPLCPFKNGNLSFKIADPFLLQYVDCLFFLQGPQRYVQVPWIADGIQFRIGCPRNNQIFFSVRCETNRNSICFGCFLVCFAKPKNIFSVCFGVSDRYRTSETNTTLSKQTEKSQKNVLYQWVLETINFLFSVRTETNRNSICFCCFPVCFFAKLNNFFFSLFRCFRPLSKQPKQTELTVWRDKKGYILTSLLLFRLVFCLFRLFQNTETPCFDIKAKQPKQTSCFGQCRNQFRFQFRLFRYETSFGGHPSSGSRFEFPMALVVKASQERKFLQN